MNNDKDITAHAGNTIEGALYANFTPVTGPDFVLPTTTEEREDFLTALETDGWVPIGQASTSGISFENSIDSNEKRVWGKSLGFTFSNFQDTVTIELASSTDKDVLRLTRGVSNVTTALGVTKVEVRQRQPQVVSLLILAKTDDNRDHFFVAENAQADPNSSSTWSEEDITVSEVKFNLLANAQGRTHYELIQDAV